MAFNTNDEKVNNLVKLTGMVEEIIYYKAEDGYSVFTFHTNDEHLYTCTGIVYQIYEGVSLEVEGNFVNHKDYGKQLNIKSYKKIEATTKEEIKRYLASGLFKGIGEKTAERIVDRFGLDTFDIIDKDHERLSEIKGITKEKAVNIYMEYLLKKSMQKVVMKLQEYDISITVATKIYEKYKSNAISVVENNPYILIDDLEEVGFKQADRIAERLGIDPIFHARIEEGIRYVLKLSSQNGNVYMPKENLIKNVKFILNIEDEDAIDEALLTLKNDKKIMIEDSLIYDEETQNVIESNESRNVYLKNLYYSEENIVEKIKQLSYLDREMYNKDGSLNKRNKEKLEKYKYDLNQIIEEDGIKLSEEQYEAVIEAIQRNVLIITGGPGTGKTTIIKLIAKYFECNEKKVSLVAPTGRAAKRITESAKMEAMTLHRLLEVTPISIENEVQRFMRNEDNPIDADVIIVDEMSMVDVMLFSSFLKAVSIGTKLILVGDEKQLPSVGPGNVFKDLVTSNMIKKISLTKIYRQDEKSTIIKNAHKIRNGELIELKEKSNDFFFVECSNEQRIVDNIKELMANRIPRFIECDKSEIQILSPVKKGIIGTQNLNSIIQETINPVDSFNKLQKEKKFGGKFFRVNDKVMQIKNDYDIEWKKVNELGFECEKGKGIFNGDVGKIISIDLYTDEIVVKFDDDKLVNYSQDMLNELEHAYAITIHKSQGSEYSAVIIPILNIPNLMCYRNLLYTGITRAKKLLVIIGSKKEVEKMALNDEEETRYTNLSLKLIKQLKVKDK